MSTSSSTRTVLLTVVVAVSGTAAVLTMARAQAPASAAASATAESIAIGATNCTAAALGTDIPTTKIGEPVRLVRLAPPAWDVCTAAVLTQSATPAEFAPAPEGFDVRR